MLNIKSLATLKQFNRNVWLYFFSVAITGFTIEGGIYAVLFNLYLLRLDYGPEFIGFINSAGLLIFAAFSLISGVIGGRWGSRRTMIAGLGLLLVGCGVLPLAEFVAKGWQSSWLVVSYIIVYIGLSLFFVNSAPFLMLNTDPQSRNPAFSVQVALWSLAGFAGALSAGVLPELFSSLLGVSLDHPAPYRFPLFIAALLMLPALISLIATQESQAKPEVEVLPTNLNLFKVGSAFLGLIAMMAVVRFFQVTSTGASMIFFNVYMDTELSASTVQIGTLSALARLLAVPAALLTPVLAARRGNGLTVVLASFGTGLCMLPLALVPHWLAAGAGYMGVMALSSMRYPAFIVYSMELVPPKWQATMSGAGEMAAGLGFAAMALSGGYIIASLGYSVLFLIACVLSIVGSLMFWAFLRTQAKQTAIVTTQA